MGQVAHDPLRSGMVRTGGLDQLGIRVDAHHRGDLVRAGVRRPSPAAAGIEDPGAGRDNGIDQPGLTTEVGPVGGEPAEALDVPLGVPFAGVGDPPGRPGLDHNAARAASKASHWRCRARPARRGTRRPALAGCAHAAPSGHAPAEPATPRPRVCRTTSRREPRRSGDGPRRGGRRGRGTPPPSPGTAPPPRRQCAAGAPRRWLATRSAADVQVATVREPGEPARPARPRRRARP